MGSNLHHAARHVAQRGKCYVPCTDGITARKREEVRSPGSGGWTGLGIRAGGLCAEVEMAHPWAFPRTSPPRLGFMWTLQQCGIPRPPQSGIRRELNSLFSVPRGLLEATRAGFSGGEAPIIQLNGSQNSPTVSVASPSGRKPPLALASLDSVHLLLCPAHPTPPPRLPFPCKLG